MSESLSVESLLAAVERKEVAEAIEAEVAVVQERHNSRLEALKIVGKAMNKVHRIRATIKKCEADRNIKKAKEVLMLRQADELEAQFRGLSQRLVAPPPNAHQAGAPAPAAANQANAGVAAPAPNANLPPPPPPQGPPAQAGAAVQAADAQAGALPQADQAAADQDEEMPQANEQKDQDMDDYLQQEWDAIENGFNDPPVNAHEAKYQAAWPEAKNIVQWMEQTTLGANPIFACNICHDRFGAYEVAVHGDCPLAHSSHGGCLADDIAIALSANPRPAFITCPANGCSRHIHDLP